jgi:hypothetical protein
VRVLLRPIIPLSPGTWTVHPGTSEDLIRKLDFGSVIAAVLGDWLGTDARRVLDGRFDPFPVLRSMSSLVRRAARPPATSRAVEEHPMSIDSSLVGISLAENDIPEAVRRDRGGPIRTRRAYPPMAGPGTCGRRVGVSVIGITGLLTSALILSVASHLVRRSLGILPEQIILVIASIAAMACVIGGLLIHGRRIVFWLFICGFLLIPVAHAADDPLLTAVAVAFFLGPLSWNAFLLRHPIPREHARPEGLDPTRH